MRLLLLFTLAVAALAQDVSFTDNTFAANWNAFRIGSTDGNANARVSRNNGGGNPNQWMQITIALVAASGGGYTPGYYGPPTQSMGYAWYFFTRADFTTPALSGAPFRTVSFSEDFLHVEHSCSDCSDSVSSMPAIRQNGLVYVARRRDWPIASGWRGNSVVELPITEFVQFGVRGGARLNLAAGAGPLEIGFVRGFELLGGEEITSGIDNFSFTLRRPSLLQSANDQYVFPNMATATHTVAAGSGLLANDFAPEGARVVIDRQPNGVLTLGSNGGFTFQPRLQDTNDSFEYHYEANGLSSSTARVDLMLPKERFFCAVSADYKIVGTNQVELQSVPQTLMINIDTDATVATNLPLPWSLQLYQGPTPLGGPVTGYTTVAENTYVVYDRTAPATHAVVTLTGTVDTCGTPIQPLQQRIEPRSYCWIVDLLGIMMTEFYERLFGELSPSSLISSANTLRQYRDHVLAGSPQLARYRELYYRHSPEMLRLMRAHPELMAPAMALVSKGMPAVEQVLAGQPAGGELLGGIAAFVESVIPHASPALAADLKAFGADLARPEVQQALTGEAVYSSATDAQGNVYLTGTINGDAFVRKLEAGTRRVLFTRVLGGKKRDFGLGVAVAPNGNIAITGLTDSDDFPVKVPLQATLAGDADAFVAVLEPGAGEVLFSSYYGGEGFEMARGIAFDRENRLYVAGVTASKRLPLRNAYQNLLKGAFNGWAAKIDLTTRTAVYSTYFGGTGADAVSMIAVDATGALWMAGGTDSRTGFPALAGKPLVAQGATDAFLAKLGPSGTELLVSVLYGGKAAEAATSLALRADGSVALGGYQIDKQVLSGWLVNYRADGTQLQETLLAGDQAAMPLELKAVGNTLHLAGMRPAARGQVQPWLARQTAGVVSDWLSTPMLAIATTQVPGEMAWGLMGTALDGVEISAAHRETTALRIRYGTTRTIAAQVSPGALMVLSGFVEKDLQPIVASDGSNPPTELAGYRIRFGEDHFALLHALQSTEAVFVVPAGIAEGPVRVQFERAGEPVGVMTIYNNQLTPHLFTSDGTATGSALGELLKNESGDETRLQLFATGLGPVETDAGWQVEILRAGGNIPIRVAIREALTGYIGLERLVTEALPASAAGLGEVRLYLRGSTRSSPDVRFVLP